MVIAIRKSDASRINVNGKVAKPSTELKVGDTIEINYYKKKMVVKVLSLALNVKKDEADGMYEVIEVSEN